jgi:hypothetical protein
MKKLFDLRFVIGLFFTVIGTLLLGYSLLGGESASTAVNRWSSVVFLVFGVFMIVLSFGGKKEEDIVPGDDIIR